MRLKTELRAACKCNRTGLRVDVADVIIVEDDDAGKRTFDERRGRQRADVVTTQLGVARRAGQTAGYLSQRRLRDVDVRQQAGVKLDHNTAQVSVEK